MPRASRRRLEPLERVVDEGGDVHFAQHHLAGAFLRAHQQDQILGQPGERRQPSAHVAQGVFVALGGAGVAERDVQFAGHRGERPAQFVRGVGREATVRLHRAPHAIEHRVEQHRHPPHLVVHVRLVEAILEMALGNPGGAFGDARHGCERARGQDVADGGRGADARHPHQRRAATPATTGPAPRHRRTGPPPPRSRVRRATR